MKKHLLPLILSLITVISLCTACNTAPTNDGNTVVSVPLADDYSAEITDAIQVDLSLGSPETVTASGAYRYSGTLADGSITVDIDTSSDEGTVYLVLDGVDLTATSAAPILITEAQKAVIILESETCNKITQNIENADENTDLPSAAIFSKTDLTLTGGGTLEVTTNYNDGITSKDTLSIDGGTIVIDAAYDGIVGKDAVSVTGGDLTINAGKDGIRSTNDKDDEKGYVAIYGGNFVINSADDCIQAVSSLAIYNGTFELTAGSESEDVENGFDEMPQNRDNFDQKPPEMPQHNDFTPPQKPDGDNPEPPQMPSDDNFAPPEMPENNNSEPPQMPNDEKRPNGRGGRDDFRGFEPQNDDGPSPKGLVCDGNVLIGGGTINIHNSYEGIEGAKITIDGGEITVKSNDDGVNVDVNGGEFVMNGGRLVITAGGDGIDSNGTITVNGGEIVVDTEAVGPADTPIDHETGFTHNGGTITDTEGNAIEVSSMGMGGGRPGGMGAHKRP